MRKHEFQVLFSELKKINLAEFIEKESGISLKKNKDKYVCVCPMPFHKDSVPSFHIYKNQVDGCWLFHCFGCNSGGTIIDFCMNYWSIEHPTDALLVLIKKSGIKDTQDIILKAIQNAKVESNLKKKIDSEHYLASKRCYSLLRKYPENKDIKKWVVKSYFFMNKMLASDDVSGIEKISHRAVVLQKDSDKTTEFMDEK